MKKLLHCKNWWLIKYYSSKCYINKQLKSLNPKPNSSTLWFSWANFVISSKIKEFLIDSEPRQIETYSIIKRNPKKHIPPPRNLIFFQHPIQIQQEKQAYPEKSQLSPIPWIPSTCPRKSIEQASEVWKDDYLTLTIIL